MLDVLIQKNAFGELYWLEESKHLIIDECIDRSSRCVTLLNTVQNPCSPSRSGNDAINSSTYVAVELLKVIGCYSRGFDKPIKFEDKLVSAFVSSISYDIGFKSHKNR